MKSVAEKREGRPEMNKTSKTGAKVTTTVHCHHIIICTR